jgi:hypothetical protein
MKAYMRILNGLKLHNIPFFMSVEEFTALGMTVKAKYDIQNGDYHGNAYLFEHDGKLIAASDTCCNTLVLCAEYKTERGFKNWLNRHHQFIREVAV